MPPNKTPYAAAMTALAAAAAAFNRAKQLGYVTLADDGRLFAVEPINPKESDDPDQLRLC